MSLSCSLPGNAADACLQLAAAHTYARLIRPVHPTVAQPACILNTRTRTFDMVHPYRRLHAFVRVAQPNLIAAPALINTHRDILPAPLGRHANPFLQLSTRAVFPACRPATTYRSLTPLQCVIHTKNPLFSSSTRRNATCAAQVPLGQAWDGFFPDTPAAPLDEWDDNALLARWSPASALTYLARRGLQVGLVVNLTYSRRRVAQRADRRRE